MSKPDGGPAEHKEIWLEPICENCEGSAWDGEGRTWCEDPANGCDQCGKEPIRYVIAHEAGESDAPAG